jgi:hypothetical protein
VARVYKEESIAVYIENERKVLYNEMATESREARTDARMGHGPEGGAWINTRVRNGGRMERDGNECGR